MVADEWLRRQQHVAIIGPTGAGKTWLACALATHVCRQHLSVAFRKTSDLYGEIAVAVQDGSLSKLRFALAKPRLLVLDDLGIGDMTSQAAQVLLDIVDRRTPWGSLLITSQYPLDKWHGLFPDPTIADAVLDRVVHQAHRIQLKGESMRKLLAKKHMQSDSAN